MYYGMLEKFEDMSLTQCMTQVKNAVEQEDYKKMKEGAHSLKGSSGYIGASHLHYACYFIQEHFLFERPAQMMEYYPTLIEAAVEFRVYSRRIIAEYKGKLSVCLLTFRARIPHKSRT